ncbi:MAG TPA: hypothetical protein VMW15_10810 [Terracidiphilus sp.]|nr:hypothetical protein [Terracidiphilus sp.]
MSRVAPEFRTRSAIESIMTSEKPWAALRAERSGVSGSGGSGKKLT